MDDVDAFKKKVADQMKSAWKMEKDAKIKYDILEVKKAEDGSVKVKAKMKMKDQNEEEETITVKKINGKWKIDFATVAGG